MGILKKHLELYHVKCGNPITNHPKFELGHRPSYWAEPHGDPADDRCSCNEDFNLVVKNDLQVEPPQHQNGQNGENGNGVHPFIPSTKTVKMNGVCVCLKMGYTVHPLMWRFFCSGT